LSVAEKIVSSHTPISANDDRKVLLTPSPIH
jgi:hypothetical protein